MLKRNISDSRRLAELKTDSARLLWTWIIPYLDVEGRYFASTDMIKGKVVPRLKTFTETKVDDYLSDMERVGLIAIYEVNGEKFLQFRKFDEHQTGLRKEREAPSRIPDPPPDVAERLRTYSGPTPDLLPHKRSEEKLREGKGREGADKPPPSPKVKYLDSVYLTADEYQKLQEVLGQKSLEVGIEKLDYSLTVKGGKYKDHYKTLLNWHKRGYLGQGSGGTGQQQQQSGGSAMYVKCPKCGKEVLDSCIDPDGLGCYTCIRDGIPGGVKDRIEAGA